MGILQTLKVVNTKRPTTLSPIDSRRNAVLKRIHEQISAAKAREQGTQHSVKLVQRIRNSETGEVKDITKEKFIRESWWTADDGKFMLQLRYGMKPLEIVKGKSTIEVGEWSNLIPTLELLKQAVEQGELDQQLGATATLLSQQLTGKKQRKQ
jgi:hypothetical protein